MIQSTSAFPVRVNQTTFPIILQHIQIIEYKDKHQIMCILCFYLYIRTYKTLKGTLAKTSCLILKVRMMENGHIKLNCTLLPQETLTNVINGLEGKETEV